MPETNQTPCDPRTRVPRHLHDVSFTLQSLNSYLFVCRENGSSIQDLKKEDFNLFIPTPVILSGSDKHAVEGKMHISDKSVARVTEASKACSEKTSVEALQETRGGTLEESDIQVKTTRLKVKHPVTETPERERKRENRDSSVESPSVSMLTETVEKTSDLIDPDTLVPENSAAPSSVEQSQHASYRRSGSTISRKTTSDSLYYSCVSHILSIIFFINIVIYN